MKRQFRLVAAVACLALGGVSLHADVVFDNYGSTGTGYGGDAWLTKPGQWVARAFTPGQSFMLSQVSPALYWQNGDRESITISLRPDNGGTPSATILESWVATTTADGYFSIPLASVLAPQLDEGTPYWIVANSDVATDERGWGQVTPSVTATIGASFNQGSSWSSFSLADVALRVEGNPVVVPEPGMLSLCGLVLAGIAGCSGRRRRVDGRN